MTASPSPPTRSAGPGPPGRVLVELSLARSGAKDLSALFDAVGITVTEEGKQRARARRREAEAHWTPERRDALRAQLGLPTRAA